MTLAAQITHSPAYSTIMDLTPMILCVQELIELITRETVLLKRMDMNGVKALQTRKTQLTDRLDDCRKSLSRQPDIAATLSPQRRSELEQLQRDLDFALTENVMQISQARRVNEILVQGITHAIDRQMNGARGYNSLGSDQHNFRKGEASVPPMNFNEVI